MSLADQEAVAMRRAWLFLLGLSSGEVKLSPAADVRAEARSIVKHFPLGGDLEAAAREMLEREAEPEAPRRESQGS